MALTTLQLEVLRLLASRRKVSGDSYIAGGVALNHVLGTSRLSRDVDLFHDTDAALVASFQADRVLLQSSGYRVTVVREAVAFVEAAVSRDGIALLLQWVRDSAFRFFPLVEDATLGLTMHPLDLATNKILALAGRLEARDWVDTISCHTTLQRLGYLMWAACGKDEGYSPSQLLDGASRQRYVQAELELLEFEGPVPSARELGAQFKASIAEASVIFRHLPETEVGTCLLGLDGRPYSAPPEQLDGDIATENVRFHRGHIGGVWPVNVRPFPAL